MTFEAVSYESIPHALVSGIAISLLCSAVGLFLVLRKFSLFGDALAHSAFGGVAFGLFIGIYPLWIACAVAILSALGLSKIRQKFDISGDAIVAILLSTGLGAGIILVGLVEDFEFHDIEEFLFGSAIINTQSVIEILGLSGGVLAILFFTYKKLLYSTFSEEQAKASGISESRQPVLGWREQQQGEPSRRGWEPQKRRIRKMKQIQLQHLMVLLLLQLQLQILELLQQVQPKRQMMLKMHLIVYSIVNQ